MKFKSHSIANKILEIQKFSSKHSIYFIFLHKIMEYLQLTSTTGFFSWFFDFFIAFSALWFLMMMSLYPMVLQTIGGWITFEKAKLPGRGFLIPVYNVYLLFKLWGRNPKLVRWILCPPVLWVLLIILNFDIAKKFNKHWAFALWLRFLPMVFYPILAFDKKTKWGK